MRQQILSKVSMRPPLRIFNPIAFYVTLCFVAFNIAIGLGIILDPPFFEPPIFLSPNNEEFFAWGVALMTLGVTKLTLLLMRFYGALRTTLIVGIVTKTIWAVGLIMDAMFNGGFSEMAAVLLALAFLEGVVFVYFEPRIVKRTRWDD